MVAPDGGGEGDDNGQPRGGGEGEGTPTLVEVNTRWHLTDFAPLTDACVGYNAVEETLSAYLDPGRFEALPRVPPTGKGSRYGRVVHLVSYVEGRLEEVLHEEVGGWGHVAAGRTDDALVMVDLIDRLADRLFCIAAAAVRRFGCLGSFVHHGSAGVHAPIYISEQSWSSKELCGMQPYGGWTTDLFVRESKNTR